MAEGSLTVSTLHGISIGSLITGAGVWTAVATLIGIILRSRVPMRKMKLEADEQLRGDLLQRVEKLEYRLEEERAQHEAAMAMMRHRLNNSDQSIEALLLILDDDDLPDKVKHKVARIRELRCRQKAAEELERDTIRAAVVAAKAMPQFSS